MTTKKPANKSATKKPATKKPAKKPASVKKPAKAKAKAKATPKPKSKSKKPAVKSKLTKGFVKKKTVTKKAVRPLAKATVPQKAVPSVAYTITDKAVSVHFNTPTGFCSRVFTKDTEQYTEIKLAVQQDRKADIVDIASRTARLVTENAQKHQTQGFELRDGCAFVDGLPLPLELSRRIVAFAEDGVPYDNLIKFWRNLQENPSRRAVQGLYRFLEAGNFPIDQYGYFIGYRRIKQDWTDVHSGKFDNSPGRVVKIRRNQVDEDPNVACSHGLHVGSFNYAKNIFSGERLVAVRVHPKDVVSVPYDYSNQKMRVCEFQVLSSYADADEIPHQVVDSAEMSSDDLNRPRAFVNPDQSNPFTVCPSCNAERTGLGARTVMVYADEVAVEFCTDCGADLRHPGGAKSVVEEDEDEDDDEWGSLDEDEDSV